MRKEKKKKKKEKRKEEEEEERKKERKKENGGGGGGGGRKRKKCLCGWRGMRALVQFGLLCCSFIFFSIFLNFNITLLSPRRSH